MKKQTNLLITSIFIILGLALLFLGAMTFLDPGYFRDEKVEGRNRAYIEIVTGFFFLCVGIIAYVIYVRQQTSKDLATSTPITQARITKEKVSRSPQVIKKKSGKSF